MKTPLLFVLLFTQLIFVACTSDETKQENETSQLKGVWTLYKETKKGKTIDYSGVPTAARMEFRENGYYIIYDQVTDEKFSQSGVSTIQDNSKGQFELKNNEIHLNRYENDSLITKVLNVEKLDDKTLVIRDNQKGKVSYFKKKTSEK